MSATAFEGALAAAGLAAEVEGRDRLVVIRPSSVAASRAIGARRAEVTALAAAHGFSHVALEVGSSVRQRTAAERDASLPGD